MIQTQASINLTCNHAKHPSWAHRFQAFSGTNFRVCLEKAAVAGWVESPGMRHYCPRCAHFYPDATPPGTSGPEPTPADEPA